jgi:hypothetical protein
MLVHFLGTRKQETNGAMDEFKWHGLQPNNLLARSYTMYGEKGTNTIDPRGLGGKYPGNRKSEDRSIKDPKNQQGTKAPTAKKARIENGDEQEETKDGDDNEAEDENDADNTDATNH